MPTVLGGRSLPGSRARVSSVRNACAANRESASSVRTADSGNCGSEPRLPNAHAACREADRDASNPCAAGRALDSNFGNRSAAGCVTVSDVGSLQMLTLAEASTGSKDKHELPLDPAGGRVSLPTSEELTELDFG